MKKIYTIVVMLIVLLPQVIYAYGVKEVNDFKNIPNISNRKNFYIVNMSDYEIKINDTKNFKRSRRTDSGIVESIVIYTRPKKSTAYNNPYYITWKNIGYYIDDNNNPVYLNARIIIDKVELTMTDTSDKGAPYYDVGNIYPNSFALDSYSLDSNGKKRSGCGIHYYFTFKLLNTNNTEISNELANSIYLRWKIADLDIHDATVTTDQYGKNRTFRESIKFNSGFYNDFYVIENTLLEVTNNNTKFIATKVTGNAATDPSADYSTVVAYQIAKSASAEWWASNGAGTSVSAVNYQYPYLISANKEANKKVYSAGDNVSYTIKQTFPFTISDNTAKSITLTDTFDSALDVSKIAYKVLDGNNRNVTNDWTLTVSKQTVTLTYNKTAFTSVVGKYTFIFNNIKVLLPNNQHQRVRMSDID